jgi:hypothetical protein
MIPPMGSWWSIEVIDGTTSAARWRERSGDALVEAALSQRAIDWAWHETTWGVILEIALPDEAAWERFRSDPAVQAALDGVPDPAHGLIVHQGRGGSAGAREPRKPRPLIGSGAAALPLPLDDDPWLAWPDSVTPRRLVRF